MTIQEITIYQGDDERFNGGGGFLINFVTEINMVGFKGRFQVGLTNPIIKDFDIATEGSNKIMLTSTDTEKLAIGEIIGYCKVFDAAGMPLTLNIPIVKYIVKQKVVDNK